jgi:hypothetical protein
MAGESKKSEEKFVKSIRLDSTLREEVISKLPRALEDRAVAKKISELFLKLGKLDEEEQKQAKIIRAALEECYNSVVRSGLYKKWSQEKKGLVCQTYYCLVKIFSACESGKYSKDAAILLIPQYPPECCEDYLELSIKHYYDVNATDSRGNTRLYYIADSERVELAAFLIRHKANINARNNEGRTPLDLALGNRRNLMCDLLRRHGAKRGSELDKQDAKEAQMPLTTSMSSLFSSSSVASTHMSTVALPKVSAAGEESIEPGAGEEDIEPGAESTENNPSGPAPTS